MYYDDINVTKRKTITNGAKYDFFISCFLNNKKKNFLVYDMRNVLQNEKIKKNNKRYFGIGR